MEQAVEQLRDHAHAHLATRRAPMCTLAVIRLRKSL